MQRSQNTDILSPMTPNIPYPHSRMAAGQEAELGHVQPLSRYTQAIKSMFQTYHQGPPDWGQICRVPCEESKGDVCEAVSTHANLRLHSMQLPFLASTNLPLSFLTLASYLSSLSQVQGCLHPPDAGIQVHPGWSNVGHLPSTAKRWYGEERRNGIVRVLTYSLFPVHSGLFP